MMKILHGFVQSGKAEEAKRVLTNLYFTHNATKEAKELYELTEDEHKTFYLLWDVLDNVTKKELLENAKDAVIRLFNFSCCLYLIWAATIPDHVFTMIGH